MHIPKPTALYLKFYLTIQNFKKCDETHIKDILNLFMSWKFHCIGWKIDHYTSYLEDDVNLN